MGQIKLHSTQKREAHINCGHTTNRTRLLLFVIRPGKLWQSGHKHTFHLTTQHSIWLAYQPPVNKHPQVTLPKYQFAFTADNKPTSRSAERGVKTTGGVQKSTRCFLKTQMRSGHVESIQKWQFLSILVYIQTGQACHYTNRCFHGVITSYSVYLLSQLVANLFVYPRLRVTAAGQCYSYDCGHSECH